MKDMDVLIIEDEGAHRKTLGRLLMPLEMNLSFLDNGKDALLLLKKKDYSIIILDWVMPGMTGIELCAVIKKNCPLTKVMMLTARNSEKDRRRCFLCGADAYITKPYDPDDLLMTIRRLANSLQTNRADCATQYEIRTDQDQPYSCSPLQIDVFEKSFVCGMIHNIRTPLSIAFNRSQLAELEIRKIENPYPETEKLLSEFLCRLKTHHRKIQSAIKKTMDVAESILHLNCLDGKENRVPLNLNRLIDQEVSFLSADLCLRFNVTFTVDLDSQIPLINGVVSDFSQIFGNIIKNACEAMEGSETRKLNIATKLLKEQIFIRFEDTGPGVDPSIMQTMFTQHRSTKEKSSHTGSGYGLGLYISKRILDSYDAKIDVEESGPSGTKIIIAFPIADCYGNAYELFEKTKEFVNER